MDPVTGSCTFREAIPRATSTSACGKALTTNYPIVGAVTPTAGGLVFFGDVGGNFYAVDASTGQKLWGQKIGGAIGGGVITYTANGVQKVAVTTGFNISRLAG